MRGLLALRAGKGVGWGSASILPQGLPGEEGVTHWRPLWPTECASQVCNSDD